MWDRDALREAVKEIPSSNRKTFRKLASELKVPKSTLHDMFKKEGLFRRHTSSLRPFLTEENKVARLFHALDEVYPVAGADEGLVFKNMYDRVDVDEKWFYLTRSRETYILIADNDEDNSDDDDDGNDDDGNARGGEENPNRTVRNSNFIAKVMFLCAQARPRYDTGTHQMWDGKIGIWPIGHFEPAQRRSTRQDAGAPVWKDEVMTKAKYREVMLQQVIPAIVEKWPRREWNDVRTIIRLQQDGAKTHIHPTDEQFHAGLVEQGVVNKILLSTQPANSPDTNTNNLGFFRALQSMYHCNCPNDEAEIIEYVTNTYYEYDLQKINYIWLTLMGCYNEIIRHHGNNNYEIPHIKKATLQRQGQLPITLQVTHEALDYL